MIGVPNPILWGIVGAILRFVPYLGALIAAAFPLALAAAVDSGWVMVVETAALFIVVETVMGQVVEPQLFGHTTGLSPLAIIVAAMFWTLVWGSPGLLLLTPLTACLVVLGRHVEYLNFIELMLATSRLSPVESFYQRVLAWTRTSDVPGRNAAQGLHAVRRLRGRCEASARAGAGGRRARRPQTATAWLRSARQPSAWSRTWPIMSIQNRPAPESAEEPIRPVRRGR